jgi:hypothetical protein
MNCATFSEDLVAIFMSYFALHSGDKTTTNYAIRIRYTNTLLAKKKNLIINKAHKDQHLMY